MFFDKPCLRSSVRMRVFVPTDPTLTKCVSQIKAPVHGFSQPSLSRVSKSDFIRHRERVEGKQLRPLSYILTFTQNVIAFLDCCLISRCFFI